MLVIPIARRTVTFDYTQRDWAAVRSQSCWSSHNGE
jgi:hypothetical protein